MKQWKWQKIVVKLTRGASTNLYGKEIWMETGEPEKIYIRNRNGQRGYVLGNWTNLGGWDGPDQQTALDHKDAEFLARGPEDFANEVPFIPFEEWSKWK